MTAQDQGYKVLLINPPVSFDVFYGEWDMSDVKSSSPPIGLLSLASTLRQANYIVKFLDAHAEGSSIEDILKQVSEFEPAVIGLTAMTLMIDTAAKIAEVIKKEFPRIKIIIGGVHVTAEPISTLTRYPCFDFAIIGEGEMAITEFLRRLEDESSYKTVQSLVWKEGEKINVNPRMPFLKELDSLPPPAFDLVPHLFDHYRLSVFGTKKFRSVGLVTSRGCPGQCTYCDLGVVGRGFRYHSAEYVLTLMKDLWKKYDVTDFLFYDDLFVGNKGRLIAICKEIIEEMLPFTWSCCARVDFVHKDTLALMKRAGCWMIEYGIESGCQRIIDSMKKHITKEKVYETIKATKRAGITSKGNFIFGNPGETHDSIRESIEFTCRLPLNYFQHTFLTPLPGAELYETADNYGVFDADWNKLSTFRINFIPNGFTRDDLVWYSKYAWRRFYLRPRIIWQELKKLRSVEDFKRLWLALKAFLKAMVRKSGSSSSIRQVPISTST